jgi:DNA-binding LacI/PurR family transcriptional regulator
MQMSQSGRSIEAARLLIEQIRAKRSGAPRPVEHKLLEFKLIKRESLLRPRHQAHVKTVMRLCRRL